MNENHQDMAGSKLIATDNKLWTPPLSPKDQKRLKHLQKKSFSERMGFSNKTGWDWLDLIAKLAVPLILGIATISLGILQANLAQQQHDNDQKIANQQRLQDQTSALDQQRQATLVKYQDDMRDLLLNRGLLTSKPGDEIRVIALTETLSAMRQLDENRNSFLIRFLQNAHLNGVDYRTLASYNIVNFLNADLIGIDFSYTDLSGADLSGADLRFADLSFAILNGTDLRGADLIGAHLRGADLRGAPLLLGAHLRSTDLRSADLRYADLSGAHLRYADLSGADLRYADLSGADLLGAKVTQEQLVQALSLKGATMPDGSVHL